MHKLFRSVKLLQSQFPCKKYGAHSFLISTTTPSNINDNIFKSVDQQYRCFSANILPTYEQINNSDSSDVDVKVKKVTSKSRRAYISNVIGAAEEKKRVLHNHEFQLKHVKLSDATEIIAGNAHCTGCGATLQTSDSERPGFIHPNAVDKRIAEQEKFSKLEKEFKELEKKKQELEHLKVSEIATEKEVSEDEAKQILGSQPNRNSLNSVGGFLVMDENEFKLYKKFIKHKGKSAKDLIDDSLSELVCQRCHQLRNYGVYSTVSVDQEAVKHVFERIANLNKKALIVLIIDLFDTYGSIIPNLKNIIGKHNVLVVANKADLLLKGRSPDEKPSTEQERTKVLIYKRLQEWVRRILKKDFGLFQTPEERSQLVGIEIVSSATGTNMAQLHEKMNSYRKGGDIYIVGCTNVGKSTFINQLFRQQMETRKTNIAITTSALPGTTLKTISFPIVTATGERANLFDTPGVLNAHQKLFTDYLKYEDWKYILPSQDVINPRFVRLRPGRCFFLSGLFRLDYIEDNVKNEEWNRCIFSVYTSPKLSIHCTSIENADQFYANHVGRDAPNVEYQIVPPIDGKQSPIYGLNKPLKFKVTGTTRRESILDICIGGIGWISVTGVGEMTFEVHTNDKVNVYLRQPCIMPYTTKERKIRKDQFIEHRDFYHYH
ncbi:hypothetical protein C9374_008396 [Naegleria lovaniensis]|uniref:G domain-containing protein n=1 Tax=Naegleria lovaniensis TaxID=51637 RepID=A0AA88KHW7_NAELO|nr:uncharacterized protein C9374_008396 [Naegleria lovaniensis]KAG2378253.1 hypothetical protein C9374_008396 [Naegleria lovaniensis]